MCTTYCNRASSPTFCDPAHRCLCCNSSSPSNSTKRRLENVASTSPCSACFSRQKPPKPKPLIVDCADWKTPSGCSGCWEPISASALRSRELVGIGCFFACPHLPTCRLCRPNAGAATAPLGPIAQPRAPAASRSPLKCRRAALGRRDCARPKWP